MKTGGSTRAIFLLTDALPYLCLDGKKFSVRRRQASILYAGAAYVQLHKMGLGV